MKLDARRIPGFLRDPGQIRCVLLHGDDAGLIRDRADQLARAIAPPDDPFRTAVLERDGHGRLTEEACALSLTGGRRVVRVREAGDALVKPLTEALAAGGDTLIVLEAPDITAQSRLRKLLEAASEAAVIGCYPEEGKSLETTIRAGLQLRRVTADPEAMDLLVRQLGVDRAVTAGEVEKLCLLVGDGGHVALADAEACVGETASLSLEDALFAATAGDVAECDRALDVAISEGAVPVRLLRAAQMHLQKLHRARLLIAAGQSTDAAARAIRPPVFFKRLPLFQRALSLWPEGRLQNAIQAMIVAEQACKRTGAPDDAISRDAIARLAQAGQAMRLRK